MLLFTVYFSFYNHLDARFDPMDLNANHIVKGLTQDQYFI